MTVRHILLITVLCVLSRNAFAQNVDYTNGCENEISNADDQLIQDAFDFVRNHEADVFDEIDRIRSSGNVHSYSFINSTTEGEWQDEVDEMNSGDIKIDCHYNASNNKCSNNAPGMLGWTVCADWWTGVRDRVHVCINNVRQSAGSRGHETALMAGLIAHELMHHVDGNEDHGPGGLTNPANPDTPAETIGVAMEHISITPDLKAEIIDLRADLVTPSLGVSLGGGSPILGGGEIYLFEVDVEVSNLNSLAGSSTTAISGSFRNATTTVSLRLDGVEIGTDTVVALNGIESRTLTFEYDSDNAVHVFEAVADSTDVPAEYNESNNDDSRNFNTKVDLSIDVAIDGDAVDIHQRFRSDLDPAGLYSWIEVTYVATISNLDSNTTSPSVDVLMDYENSWTQSGLIGRLNRTIRPLEPGESTQLGLTVEVPGTNAQFGVFGALEPSGTTTVSMIVDPGNNAAHDSNRSNNDASFEITDDTWKPDYRIERVMVLVAVGTGDATINYTVHNIGPVEGGAAFVEVYGEEPNPTAIPRIIGGLGVGDSVRLSKSVQVPECDVDQYTIVVDTLDQVDESDEDNNTSFVSVGEECDDPVLDDWIDLLDTALPGTIDTGIHIGIEDFGGSVQVETATWIETQFDDRAQLDLPRDTATAWSTRWPCPVTSCALISQPYKVPEITSLDRSRPTAPPEPIFRRGDVNGDNLLDMTDALLSMDYQLLGGYEPSCEDALDFDDTGAVDLTDVIRALGFLFLGTVPPPAQPRQCGPDPTDDTLGCSSHAACAPVF